MNDKNNINNTLVQEKLQLLQEELRRLGSVMVAFSGGVDSTFLLQVAHLTLGEKALALTARSGVVPQRDLREAEAFCAKYGIRHLYFDFDELAVPGFAENPPDRCYICKKTLFSNFLRIAKENGAVLCEGSNMDDLGDYRPGLKALAELKVQSPLRTAVNPALAFHSYCQCGIPANQVPHKQSLQPSRHCKSYCASAPPLPAPAARATAQRAPSCHAHAHGTA